MIEIKNIIKNYGELEVLKNVSLNFQEGQIVSIIGPSGSGKSTLLRSINGLEKVQEGQIIIDGLELNYNEKHLNKLREKIGMVFQNFNLFPHLTVLENIILAPTKILKINKEDAKLESIEILKKVGLFEKRFVYPNQLSGGQKQRVAIARALAMKPNYMLYDEPTSALDPEMISEVLQVIKKVANSGITTIIVTHEINFAKSISDRIIFIDEGKIIADEHPEKLFDNYNNKRIENFIKKITIH